MDYIATFIRTHIPVPFGTHQSMKSYISAQLYQIHQSYVLQCMRDLIDKDTIGNRTMHNERQAKNKAKPK